MTILVVYHLDGQWFGEVVTWKRSGTGFYREPARVELPQTKAEIEAFAAENGYKIEWRGPTPKAPAAAYQ